MGTGPLPKMEAYSRVSDRKWCLEFSISMNFFLFKAYISQRREMQVCAGGENKGGL